MSNKEKNGTYIANKIKKGVATQEIYYNMYPPKTREEALKKTYAFWDTQPVPKITDIVTTYGEIQSISLDEVKNTRYNLPKEFMWDTLDLANDDHMESLAQFLNTNYVETPDSTFRQNYSKEFLKWVYSTNDSLLLSVKVKNSGKYVGFIGSSISNITVNLNKLNVGNINFLCVHKKLRLKRLTPVLIKEMTRLLNEKGISQAEYTSERYLPTPIGKTKMYHYPLDFKKLTEVKFCEKRKDASIEQVVFKYKLLENELMNTFSKLTENDIPLAYSRLQKYMRKYNYHKNYTLEEFTHIFYNNPHMTTLVKKTDDGTIEDMLSYYKLKSKVLTNSNHSYINAGYLYLYTSIITTPYEIMYNALRSAHIENLDVFNVWDIMENNHMIENFNMLPGTGKLFYYLYNWTAKEFENSQNAMITF